MMLLSFGFLLALVQCSSGLSVHNEDPTRAEMEAAIKEQIRQELLQARAAHQMDFTTTVQIDAETSTQARKVETQVELEAQNHDQRPDISSTPVPETQEQILPEVSSTKAPEIQKQMQDLKAETVEEMEAAIKEKIRQELLHDSAAHQMGFTTTVQIDMETSTQARKVETKVETQVETQVELEAQKHDQRPDISSTLAPETQEQMQARIRAEMEANLKPTEEMKAKLMKHMHGEAQQVQKPTSPAKSPETLAELRARLAGQLRGAAETAQRASGPGKEETPEDMLARLRADLKEKVKDEMAGLRF